jgi:hypothetical protein
MTTVPLLEAERLTVRRPGRAVLDDPSKAMAAPSALSEPAACLVEEQAKRTISSRPTDSLATPATTSPLPPRLRWCQQRTPVHSSPENGLE